jgi:copper homeostasis protein (lipoprotein)
MQSRFTFSAAMLMLLSGCAAGPAGGPAAPAVVAPSASVTLPLPATFTGDLPCADCEAIEYRVDLFADRAFYLRMNYRGRPGGPFDDLGSWDYASDGRAIILQGGREAPLRFSLAGPDELSMLDLAGLPIDSPLNYTLRRASGLEPLEPRLMLRGMYRYMADAGIIDECASGRRMPVAMEEDNAALERGYLAVGGEPGAPLMALVEGRVALCMPMEGPGPVPTLIPERFLRMAPGESCPPRFATAPLAGTFWALVSLGDDAVYPTERRPGPHIEFHATESRVAGSDGCNRFMGGYQQDGDALTLSQLASTMMACVDGTDVAQRYTAALGDTRRYRALGRHLELFAADGALLARFEARSPST